MAKLNDKLCLEVTFGLDKDLDDDLAEKAFDLFNAAVFSVSAYLEIEGFEVVSIDTATKAA